jgi:tetratricopeptide (TPR) repeat protein
MVCRSGNRDGHGGRNSRDSVPSSIETLEILRSLVDKNLVRRIQGTSDGAGSAGRDTRFGMLEAIREYVREKLEESGPPGETQAVERTCALYFMSLAEQAEPQLRGAGQVEWLNRLEEEHSNLLATLSWAIGKSEGKGEVSDGREVSGAAEIGLRTAAALTYFWFIRGYFSEGRDYLEAALAQSTTSMPSLESPWSKTAEQLQGVRARALQGKGILVHEMGDHASGRALLEESLALRRKINDKVGIASALNSLGVSVRDYATSRAYLEESLAIWREIGDRRGEALALTNLGRTISDEEDRASARALYEEGLVIWREIDDKRGTALCLTYLGFIVYTQGEYDAARALFEEGLTIHRELGNKWGVASVLAQLGSISFVSGDNASARALHEESLALLLEMGHKEAGAKTLHSLALVICSQGEYVAARTMLQESLPAARNVSDTNEVLGILAALGAVTAMMQAGVEETLRGARLLGASDALHEKLGLQLSPEDRITYERGVGSAQTQLSEDDFERAWSEGSELTFEQAITYALQDDGVPFSSQVQP